MLTDLDEAQALFGSSFNVLAHYGHEQQWGGAADEIRGRLMAKIGALKMLCSHPDLVKDSAIKFHQMNGEGSAYAAGLSDDGHLEGITSSPKLDMLTEYVTAHLDMNPANKVVIFASYVGMLEKIAEALGPERCRLYSGQMDAKTKEDNKIAFNTQEEIRVLISSDAGGYGVDLPAANLLVNYDLPWSSGGAIQRNGRIKRASSTWPTIVIQDMIMKNSIEERQHQALMQKTSIANAVVDGLGIDDDGGVPITLTSLRQFLQTSNV